MPSLLDCLAQLTLMCGACSDYPPRDYLASFGDKVSQGFDVLIINYGFFIATEAANFFSGK